MTKKPTALVPNRAFRALADPSRRQILRLLRDRARSSGDIAAQFPTTWAAISRHLAILRSANLIAAERNGASVVYALNSTVVQELAAHVLDWLSTGRTEAPVQHG